ncbi:MAG: hypothetical protein AAB858_02040 [Patescibacteria group bacterium]
MTIEKIFKFLFFVASILLLTGIFVIGIIRKPFLDDAGIVVGGVGAILGVVLATILVVADYWNKFFRGRRRGL